MEYRHILTKSSWSYRKLRYFTTNISPNMKAPCWFLAEVMVFQQQGKEGLAKVLDTLVAVYGGLVAKLCLTLATQWTTVRLLYLGFSRQEYWSGLPFPSPGDLPDAGIEPGSPALQADSLRTEL